MTDINDLRTAFCKMFAIEKPYDFQIRVAEQLLIHRKSVILQAPTGSGKTWTALFPFLHAWRTGLFFPRKCLYAVPLRVLATQFVCNAEDTINQWQPETEKPKISLQTGEQQNDRTFESDLIFTTIDQVLSSALSVPYSLGYRRANVNAGAVFSSFLVCDELHLFPIDEKNAQGALATLIELLRTIGNAIPFLLMTATLSEKMLSTLETQLQATSIVVDKKELMEIDSQQKTRRYHVVNAPLQATDVLSKHCTRSIVICNQVSRAIDLFDNLCQVVNADPQHQGHTQVALLHSRFVHEHRQEIERTLRDDFAKGKSKQRQQDSRIIVATQAIEVGLDITCERLHTELAPANAIIQRAGRCARYKGETGDVFIYRLPDDTQQPHLPYDATRCTATWQVFSNPQYNGQPLTFAEEQHIVTQVHDPSDEKLLGRINRESHTRWQAMSAAMFRGEKEGRVQLIRKVDSRTLIVHPNPDDIKKPYAWRGFSIFHGTLRAWINRLRITVDPLPDWWLKYPVEVRMTEEESRQQPTYNWHPASDPAHIDMSPIFAINPDLVAYDRQRGFRLIPTEVPINIDELLQEPTSTTSGSPLLTRYNIESYAEHIDRMWHYYNESGLETQIQLAGKRLQQSRRYGCTADLLDRAVRLAIALHDVGKLQVEWQQWSHRYQQEIGDTPNDPNMMIVHTNYKPHDALLGQIHRDAEKYVSTTLKLHRPRHAAEGAWASWPIILRGLDDDQRLSQAVFTAIARHHTPFVRDAEKYTLHTKSKHAIANALTTVGLTENLAQHTRVQSYRNLQDSDIEDQLIESGDPTQWLIYMLIVRTLRLCDGHALEGVE